MWPLLLPDAVCMAGSLTGHRVSNHMTTTSNSSSTSAAVTRDRGIPVIADFPHGDRNAATQAGGP
jgi:hypothetical protein